jgi:hypothetical protein
LEIVDKGVEIAAVGTVSSLVSLLQGTDYFEAFATGITACKILSLTLLRTIDAEENHNCQEYNK